MVIREFPALLPADVVAGLELRQNVISGSLVATCAIIGPIDSCSAAKNAWKLASSGHSSTTMIWPSLP